jgi:2-polyprenyl-3-methyl-5-hydroxy-6-metoxy-1,4-benzoquinol methylase
MLDVGCGAGQIAIPAARAGVDVTGVTLRPTWLNKPVLVLLLKDYRSNSMKAMPKSCRIQMPHSTQSSA